MRSLIDNLAVVMVVVMFGVVIALVVQYNMINEDTSMEFVQILEEKPANKKETTKDYLNELESYSDVDVQVDPTKETQTNTVKVVSEETKSEIETALKADEKKDYLKKLEHYSDEKQSKTASETLEDVKPESVQNNDTIGEELDNILGE